MASIKVIPSNKLPIRSLIHKSMLSQSRDNMALLTTQAWSTKITSHMVMAELFIQITHSSLMDNGKMEQCMDTLE